MTIYRNDVQAVWKFKELKSYCEHKDKCDLCVFYNKCPFRCNLYFRDEVEEAACEVLVSGELGDDLEEGDDK